MDEWDDFDICDECQWYNDDYYMDAYGELHCACDGCPFSPWRQDEDD